MVNPYQTVLAGAVRSDFTMYGSQINFLITHLLEIQYEKSTGCSSVFVVNTDGNATSVHALFLINNVKNLSINSINKHMSTFRRLVKHSSMSWEFNSVLSGQFLQLHTGYFSYFAKDESVS